MYKKMADGNYIYFDVDSTLISYFPIEGTFPIKFHYNGVVRDLYPMIGNIDLIDELRISGHKIVIWSRSGANHAERIVNLLNLNEKVDLIIAKPTHYVDDKEFSDQGIPRIYKI